MQTHIDDLISQKKTVLQLITGLGVGGAERVVIELAGRLSEQGVRSVVVALNHDRSLLGQYTNSDLLVFSLGMNKNPWSIIKAQLALIKIMQRERVSLIHAHMFHALCVALICKIFVPRCKLVFTSHNSKGFSLLRRIVIRMTKILRSADVVFVAGQHATMNAKRTVVIPNGVPIDPEKYISTKSSNNRRVFLFVGRLEPVKNPVGLVRSFAMMLHKDCDLWLAGDGILRTEVEQEISILGLQDRVHMLGVRQDIPQILEQVDCFVMASFWEGLPMAILEAGAMALPVVASPVGAIPALLGNNCGYLADVSDLHLVLDAVLDNFDEARQRGTRLRDKVLNGYSLEHMTKAHVDLYSTVQLIDQI